jgi:amidase
LPATEQLAALDSKGVSSAELVELYLSRIAEHNPPLNAVVTVDADGARRAAKQADAARSEGQRLGPLHGLPITVKDSYETAGMRTVCGRPDLADHVPTQDAEAVARLRRSGAGAPATTMPVTTNSAGLPIGIQAMGPPGGDRTTVEFAALLTETLGGYRIPPQQRSSLMSTT